MYLLEVGLLVIFSQLAAGQWGWPNFGWRQMTSGSNPQFNTTMTCSFKTPDMVGSITLQRNPDAARGMFRMRATRPLIGKLAVRSRNSESYHLVFSELSRTEPACTNEGLGHLMQPPRALSQPRLLMRWFNPRQEAASDSTELRAVVTTIDLSPNEETIMDLASATLPERLLERYAGRGIGLCTDVIKEGDFEEICVGTVAACCTLGYDNQIAVTPTLD